MDFQLSKKLSAAVEAASRALESNKHPVMIGEVDHTYDDKFAVAEYVIRSGRDAAITILKTLGMTDTHLQTAQGWSSTDRTTLEFKSEEFIDFEKQTEREESSGGSEVGISGIAVVKSKTVTKIKEWHWLVRNRYKLMIYPGTKRDQSVTILHNEICTPATTLTEDPPVATQQAEVCDLHWLISCGEFKIDRSAKGCFTPSQNADVDAAFGFFGKLKTFNSDVVDHFRTWCSKFNVKGIFKEDDVYDSSSIFNPSQTFLIKNNDTGEVRPPTEADIISLQKAQSESLGEKASQLSVQFKVDTPTLTTQEATLLMALSYGISVVESVVRGVRHLEQLLYSQLRKAIASEITTSDFDTYMKYHSKKLFSPKYQPVQLSYPLRSHPSQNPAANFMLSRKWSVGDTSPVLSICSTLSDITPSVAISSSCVVKAPGVVRLHAMVHNVFAGEKADLELRVTTKRFNGVIAVMGTVREGELVPSHAVTLIGPDTAVIPLTQELIASGTDFNEAIDSLSPKQREFALAYREMQLSNSLFGVLLVPLRPNLEHLLNLPENSLCTEVGLVNTAIELISKYQISGHLLAFTCDDDFEDPDDVPTNDKITKVWDNIKKMTSYIDHLKKKELEEEEIKKMLHATDSPTSATSTLRYSALDICSDAGTSEGKSTNQGGGQQGSCRLSAIPHQIDKVLLSKCGGSSVRQAILKPSSSWTTSGSTVGKQRLTEMRTDALALLEIFTNTADIPLHPSSHLHIFVSLNHSFEMSLIDTLVKKSINPTEHIERTALICASVVHDVDVTSLLADGQVERVNKYSPSLLE